MPLEAGTALPPLWHWLYFLPLHRQSEVGDDGHPRRGGFLPPCRCRAACGPAASSSSAPRLRIGDRIARTSTIDDVTTKEGRSGTAGLRQGAP